MYDEMTNSDLICTLTENARLVGTIHPQHWKLMAEAARRIEKLEDEIEKHETSLAALFSDLTALMENAAKKYENEQLFGDALSVANWRATTLTARDCIRICRKHLYAKRDNPATTKPLPRKLTVGKRTFDIWTTTPTQPQ